MLKKQYLQTIFVLTILLICEVFFFRNVIGVNNEFLIGDRGDGRLTTLLAEHWWNFFIGNEQLAELSMFYPQADVLGYTDLFLGFGLVHSIFRFIGYNIFLSYKYSLILFHLVGTFSMYYLLKCKFNLNAFCSLLATITFCFSSAYAIHFYHTQLNAVSFLPILLILFIGFIQNYNISLKRNIYALSFITWFVLLSYTAWYIALFTSIFCLIYIIVFYIITKIKKPQLLSLILKKVITQWRIFIVYVLYTFVLYIPFIYIYFPVFKHSTGYPYSVSLYYSPKLIDLLNVGSSNLVLGNFITQTNIFSRELELKIGFSIIIFLMFFYLSFIQLKKLIKKTITIKDILLCSTIVCTIITILCVIRFTDRFSGWWFLYTLLPIVRSVRAISRFIFWLSFPVAIVISICINKYFDFKEKETKIFSLFLIILVFISNINTNGISSDWSYLSETDFINNVKEPPKDIKSFYIGHSNTSHIKYSGYTSDIKQLDAFEIANYYKIKTINGYSGLIPPFPWNGIRMINSENYEKSVYAWVLKHKLTNVYMYNIDTNDWEMLQLK